MPDGSPGVMWRGVSYSLLEGARIDVSDGAVSGKPSYRHAVLPGDDATWVLLEGGASTMADARAVLRHGGIAVTRSGRWLGESADGTVYDWFLCCAGAIAPDAIARVLGSSSDPAIVDAQSQGAVLEQRLAGLLAEMARLQTELLKPAAHPVSACPPPSKPEAAPADALRQLPALQALAAGASTRQAALSPRTVSKLQDELAIALRALRRDVELLRGSLIVAVGEFQFREMFWKAVSELPLSGSRPDGWKMLRGADRWWERHVSNGRDYDGRAYARFSTPLRQWQLLLGWKADQAHDIAWLQRQ